MSATASRWSRSARSRTCRYIRSAPASCQRSSVSRDLVGRAGDAVLAQLVGLPADRRRPSGDLGLVGAQAQHGGRRVGDRRRVAVDRLARLGHELRLLDEPLDRRERQVVLGGVAGGQRRRPLRSAAADDDRDAAVLHRLRQRRRVVDRVVLARRTRTASPAGVAHMPVMIASCSSSRSKRSPSGGNGIAYASCSRSYQPAPRPSSTRPPDIWSTPATEIASGPGRRNVADVTSVPRRIVDVSRASPASVIQASVGPGRPPASSTAPIAR